MIGLLNDEISIKRVMNTTVAGFGDTLKGTIVDCQGYDGVMFVALLGDVAATAVGTLKAATGDTNDTADMAVRTGAGAATGTASATSADNKVLVIDVPEPADQYVEVQLARATANIAVDGIIAIRYKARSKPTTHDASVLASFEYAPRAASV